MEGIASQPGWYARAACRGHKAAHLWDDDRWSIAPLSICRTCPVKRECAELAISYADASDCGIWGFTTFMQRGRIRRRRLTLERAWERNASLIDKRNEEINERSNITP